MESPARPIWRSRQYEDESEAANVARVHRRLILIIYYHILCLLFIDP